jgi:hypothetical protein
MLVIQYYVLSGGGMTAPSLVLHTITVDDNQEFTLMSEIIEEYYHG